MIDLLQCFEIQNFAANFHFMTKICFFCGSSFVVKDGHYLGVQRYRCRSCGKRFINKKRLSSEQLYDEYLHGKQTLSQLSHRHKVSVSTIQRLLRKVRTPPLVSSQNDVVVLMDATYWNNRFGVLAFKDAHRKCVLWYKFLYRHETVEDYRIGVNWLEEHHYNILGIVCDGLKGLFRALERYPVQYCQFHQIKTIQTKLTKHPESAAGRELLELAYQLTRTDKESFEGALQEWWERHHVFMNERSEPSSDGKTHYLHKRLRSAYLSLKRNSPHLWVWYDHIELNIPNTNNGIESMFTDLKTKMRVHNGMINESKERFIKEYFRHLDKGE